MGTRKREYGRVDRTAKDGSENSRKTAKPQKFEASKLRIIAGNLRGRRIDYNGDPGTRPMKDRTREAVFSLLGGKLPDTFAIDLFAGTGVLAFESVSRGSNSAVALELSRPAVITMIANLQALGIQDAVQVCNVDTLRWFRTFESLIPSWPQLPWVVYCCPPYKMWHSDEQQLCDGIRRMFELAPSESQFVCETEHDFDLQAAIPEIEWDIRTYAPAFVGVARK